MIDIKVLNDFNRPLKVIGDELLKKLKNFFKYFSIHKIIFQDYYL